MISHDDGRGIVEQPDGLPHPLDPLSAREIRDAVEILRTERSLDPEARFCLVSLVEPNKRTLAQHASDGVAPERVVAMSVLTGTPAIAYEAQVSLDARAVVDWQAVYGVQPMITFEECERGAVALHADQRWQAAILLRGYEDFDAFVSDGHPVGSTAPTEYRDRRLAWYVTWRKDPIDDNVYAHPVENLRALLDLTSMEVLLVEDSGVVPIPAEPADYRAASIPMRVDLQPLNIVQDQGPSFMVDGYRVTWQRWSLRIGWAGREGLVLHDIAFEMDGRRRSILHRAALSDLIVPYGDPRPGYYHRSPFDIGEFPFGSMANSLELGCDCLGEIRYFDVAVADGEGKPRTIRNAVCMHEEDYGVLWKHNDQWTPNDETRRSRRLVVSSFYSAGNYEYGVFWYFYLDGSIQMEIKLTGIIWVGALTDRSMTWGEPITPELVGPVHQHYFVARLDFDIDGEANSVIEVNSRPAAHADDPFGGGVVAERTFLDRESTARRRVQRESARHWVVVNENVANRVGRPVGFAIHPGEVAVPLARSDSDLMRRAGFLTDNFFVTAASDDELYASGRYPNQHPGNGGLPSYQSADRTIRNADIVVWYAFGSHHVTRPEDWPVMPVAYVGFWLKPSGFFDRNPALDVPPGPPSDAMAGGCHCSGGACSCGHD